MKGKIHTNTKKSNKTNKNKAICDQNKNNTGRMQQAMYFFNNFIILNFHFHFFNTHHTTNESNIGE